MHSLNNALSEFLFQKIIRFNTLLSTEDYPFILEGYLQQFDEFENHLTPPLSSWELQSELIQQLLYRCGTIYAIAYIKQHGLVSSPLQTDWIARDIIPSIWQKLIQQSS